jgi:hypothetical protein
MRITVEGKDMTEELLEVADSDEFRKMLTKAIDDDIIAKLKRLAEAEKRKGKKRSK